MTFFLTLVFVLSGAAGLIYESIWSRYLGLFVGHSAYAQVIVLVIFLGGMSLGAAITSKRSARLAEPLLWYAIVELVVGLLGLYFHDVFIVVSGFAYDTIFPALAGGPVLGLVKWTIAALLILPQSVLLGATFPLMSAGFLRRLGRDHADPAAGSGRVIGVLYFANSIGATMGVLVAGFWLIGAVGLPGTLITAALVNIVVAVATYAALQVMRDTASVPDEVEAALDAVVLGTPVLATPAVAQRPGIDLWTLLLGVSFGTAVASFIYEIAWIRMLSLVLGSATHAFELMLSAFILGLALGAFWIRRRADSAPDPVRLLAIVQFAMGTFALATLAVYGSAFHWMALLIEALDENAASYRLYNLSRYGISLAVMLPATFCAGVTLPLITRMLLGAGHGERSIGAVYAWNTLGSIVGVAAAALWLMPLLGLKGLLVTGAAIDIALAVLLLWYREWSRPEVKGTAIVAAVAAAVVIAGSLLAPSFDPGILSSGVFRYGTVPKRGERVVQFYEDGRTASVSVRLDSDSGYSLATNGKPDASISRYWFDEPPAEDSLKKPLGGDESTQVLLPLITLAHVPRAKQAAVIGHGSGMTSHLLLGSELLDDLVTIDIEPQMIEASKLFRPANLRAYDDPRSHFVHDDAKSYFAASATRYDLILSEPSNPWVSGVSGLFTDEFYSRIRGYLTPEGVFGQWLHLYEIDDELVLDVLSALHKNFRSYAVYLTANTDILVVASNAERLPTPDWAVTAYTDIALDLARFVPITPDALDATLLVTRAELAPLLDSLSDVNSDFRPLLDLGAERTRFLRQAATGFLGISRARFDLAAALGERRRGLGQALRAAIAIPRLESQALGARLRTPTALAPNDTLAANRKFQQARSRQVQLDLWMASGRAPTDWFTWFTNMLEVEGDRHAGTIGGVDSVWYATVERYMRDQRAPRDGAAALRVMRAATTYDWPTAAREVLPLLKARAEGRQWVPPEFFYDAAIVARLRVGDITGARTLFGRMAATTGRKSTDLRQWLLDAHIRAAEKGIVR